MADITKCNGNGCPKRDTCYRYTAMPNKYRQSYFVSEPNDGAVCNEYVKAYPIDEADFPPPDSGFVKL